MSGFPKFLSVFSSTNLTSSGISKEIYLFMGGWLFEYNYELSYFALSSCAGRFLVGVVSAVAGAVVSIGVEVCGGEVFGVSESDGILSTCLNSKLLSASILSAFLEKG